MQMTAPLVLVAPVFKGAAAAPAAPAAASSGRKPPKRPPLVLRSWMRPGRSTWRQCFLFRVAW